MAKILLIIFGLILTVGSIRNPTDQQLPGDVIVRFSFDPCELKQVSSDFGGMVTEEPQAVFHPNSSEDVVWLVRAAYESSNGFKVSARGNGHSTNGQAQVKGGVIIEMNKMNQSEPIVNTKLMYVDCWGGELWIDVLKSTLKYGLAPKTWTDYLYITVGGTLSNAGISGQTYYHGPQISNVYELDVVTGKGELITCSEEENEELYHGVLGGLGQFGIITRARIALELAPQRVKWIQVMYPNFKTFTDDQEYLISLTEQRFDYVEGFVRGKKYWIEITKNYNQSNADTINQEVEVMLQKLKYIPSSIITQDVAYIDFLDRVHNSELELRSKNMWEVPHPWLNFFIPKSRIADFDKGVFKGILGNSGNGPLLIYPMNKSKWNEKNTAVVVKEDVFYTVAILSSAMNKDSLENVKIQNRAILEYCRNEGIKVKQYLPQYNTQKEWIAHFEEKWARILRLKTEFDPRHILATGQKIFNF